MSDIVVIWSGEHRAYWRTPANGYTTELNQWTGTYSREEAESLTGHCGPEKKIELRPVRIAAIEVPVLVGS